MVEDPLQNFCKASTDKFGQESWTRLVSCKKAKSIALYIPRKEAEFLLETLSSPVPLRCIPEMSSLFRL